MSDVLLTDRDIYRYFQCPHWPYWERYGDPADRRPLSLADEERLADWLQFERRIGERYLGAMQVIDCTEPDEGFAETLARMREGDAVIYGGWLVDGDWQARPDALVREEGESLLGSWYYVPVDIKRAHELKKEHMALLTFYAVLLERIQGRFPAQPFVLNPDGARLHCVASDFLREFDGIMNDLTRVVHGECPEPVYRKSCEDTSPWGKACFRLAKEKNDVALLFNVDRKKLQALRNHGIRTVEDASEIDPSQLEGVEPGFTLRSLTLIRQQARTLVDGSVFIRYPWTHETVGSPIYFDIESHPPTDVDYLYGFLIPHDGEFRYVAFTAESPEDEEKMWRSFVEWLPSLPESYTLYHYASYEPTRIRTLASRYGDAEHPDVLRFSERMFDLKEASREYAVFPLYFYSLKLICRFLGFSWSGSLQSGAESIGVYERWLKEKDPSILETITRYNEDDVRATAFLHHWLDTYAREERVYAPPYPWSSI